MDMSTLLIIAAGLLFVIMFLPDILPFCACCRKVKPLTSFKVVKPGRLVFNYSSSTSICKRCSIKYNIESITDYETLKRIRRKVEMEIDEKSL